MSNGADRVAFLGPEGTFTEEALLADPPAGQFAPFPYPSIQEAMQAVADGAAELAIVPIENSLEGSVTLTLDLLAFGFDELTIVREVAHAIRHQLIARTDLPLDEVTKVVSIPIAYGQCRRFIQEHLATVEHEATDSTAEAVRRVSRGDRPWVAIGTRLSADLYECTVIRDDIEGKLGDPPIEQALKCLACKLPRVKVLGSFPA